MARAHRATRRLTQRTLRAAIESLEVRRLLATFTVTNVNDSGAGSFRQALLNASADNLSADTINFNIAGAGVHTISPQSALPQIDGKVTINGTSQPGYTNKPLIEIEGGDTTNVDGIVVFRSDAVIRALCINNFDGIGIHVNVGAAVITGCFIGTDPTGMLDRGNRHGGVLLNDFDCVLGGPNALDRNIISANKSTGFNAGVVVGGDNVTVRGNYIGVAADGVTPLGNEFVGLNLAGAEDCLIANNVIAYSAESGVLVTGSSPSNEILGNSIYATGGIGIDLLPPNVAGLPNGRTANDTLDPDLGGNSQQNFPVITSVAVPIAGNTATVAGTLNTKASRTYRIEFFASHDLGSADLDEGAVYLGFTTVTTNASGNASFNVVLNGKVTTVCSITATATDTVDDATSEFSDPAGAINVPGTAGNDVIVVSAPAGSIAVTVNGQVRTFPAGIVNFLGIDCGDGADTVNVDASVTSAVFVLGGAGNDTINGGLGRDTVFAGGDNDRVDGGGNDDRLNGGPGRDYLSGNVGVDRLYGDAHNDSLHGGPGIDRLYGGENNDQLNGGTSADILYGENGDDALFGNDGDDNLQGAAGFDQLFGQNGNDTLDGGDSADTVSGGNQNDFITGGFGNDRLSGDGGNDTIIGGAGNDVLLARDGFIDEVVGSTGTDSAEVDNDDLLSGVETLL